MSIELKHPKSIFYLGIILKLYLKFQSSKLVSGQSQARKFLLIISFRILNLDNPCTCGFQVSKT